MTTAHRTSTFVGFGFGPIQTGLFLAEAQRSGRFSRLVVAEVQGGLVRAVRRAGGRVALNVAYPDGVAPMHVGPIEMLDPASPTDRRVLVEAVAEASEMATAVPNVDCYATADPGSLHRVLAEGLDLKHRCDGPRAVIYAAENHNHAAELLREAVTTALPSQAREATLNRVRFLNTVIGKMSVTVAHPAAMVPGPGLVEVTPGAGRAFVVEAFNRILVSRADFGGNGFQRGLSAFVEKDDLMPFEEAKLYGHNAVHAMAGYLGALCGATLMADLPQVPGMMPLLRDAFINESGAALIRKHAGLDPLFAESGYTAYADDLLQRMITPHLHDTIDRVTRQSERKLGWNDRLVGTMRLALSQGVQPWRFALATAAAAMLEATSQHTTEEAVTQRLRSLWSDQPPTGEQNTILDHIHRGMRQLAAWLAAGRPPLDSLRPPTTHGTPDT
jgi:mannitol-1-phosphate 5-dehydrogenase